MKKILITGGAGFIGSNLALKLVEKGYDVTVFDNLSEQIHGKDAENNSPLFLSIKDKVDLIRGSITDRKILSEALKGKDCVVHYAAETGTGQSMYEIQKYVDININGTALLLDILANDNDRSVRKIVVASSRSIYGEGKYLTDEGIAVYPSHRLAIDMDNGDFDVKANGTQSCLTLVATDEESKIHPSSVYGITKQNQEQLVMTVCPTLNIAPVAFRYQNVYGPGQSLSNPYTGILSIFSTLIKNKKDINIFEDGKESRDFVFIDDVVDATILGIEKEEANGHVFNVGTGEPIDVMTVANTLMTLYNGASKISVSGNYRLGDIRHNYADLTKINTLIGFKPNVKFDQGIKQFVQWVNQQEVNASSYEKSLGEMRDRGLLK